MVAGSEVVPAFVSNSSEHLKGSQGLPVMVHVPLSVSHLGTIASARVWPVQVSVGGFDDSEPTAMVAGEDVSPATV